MASGPYGKHLSRLKAMLTVTYMIRTRVYGGESPLLLFPFAIFISYSHNEEKKRMKQYALPQKKNLHSNHSSNSTNFFFHVRTYSGLIVFPWSLAHGYLSGTGLGIAPTLHTVQRGRSEGWTSNGKMPGVICEGRGREARAPAEKAAMCSLMYTVH